ncbi:hypothetical protein BLL42_05530 [Pseudomonas frederiksbergensis]|uniref:Protein-S-isoprenylcysteine O-methyltransferase Ste14 n=2 Tax=Pseudomonas frederiksbergensis TaxID=104087 RepID=A0A1J0EGU5_9PSED|nr:hypothetical protein BLL42_05530 [Pseudomonas frederiksbergensis]
MIYVLWIFVELKVVKRDKGSAESNTDHGTVIIYGYARVLHVVMTAVALLLPALPAPSLTCIYVGSVLVGLGVVIRQLAIYTLGRHYSHLIDIKNDHKIVDYGIYKLVRHPAYTGMLVGSLGLTISYFSYPSLIILIFTLIPSILNRISHEERELIKVDGYRSYMGVSKKFIPYVY